MAEIRRREFIASGALVAGALASPAFLRQALAAPARAGAGPYGPLQGADATGLMLPAGFSSRELARGMQPVAGTGYPWHIYSDGAAAYQSVVPGEWIVVSNSESIAASGAGSSAIRFAPNGDIKEAYRILAGTNLNCAGGPTTWGTWLSCEEHPEGLVWETDPAGRITGEPRPALGSFNHEAAAVDCDTGLVYLTEDEGDGGFYRFTPAVKEDLSAGKLDVAVVRGDGSVTWKPVPNPNGGARGATRSQVPDMTKFDGGEGAWFASGVVYFTTKGDRKVWAYNARANRMEVIFDRAQAGEGNALNAVDNVTVSAFGDIFVCEDGGNMEVGLISAENTVSPFLRFADQAPDGVHGHSEVAGVVFDPTQTRMYVASQGAYPQPPYNFDQQFFNDDVFPGRSGPGAVYEISGPFRIPAGGIPHCFVFGPPAGELRSALSPRGNRGRRRLRVRAARRVVRSTLLRRGLTVRVTVNEPAQVELVLRTHDLGRRRPRRRGNPIKRPTSVTLARKRLRIKRAGTTKLRLKLSRAGRRRLARRRKALSARLVASSRGSGGVSAASAQTVRIGRARRRPRRRARAQR
jgi:Bacterial protein of unknown function (DUF839)